MRFSEAEAFLKAEYRSIINSLKEIRKQAQNYRRRSREDDPGDDGDDGAIEIRLYLRPDLSWDLQFGDGQYDQDHRGWCAPDEVAPDATDRDLGAMARRMITEICDRVAEDDADEAACTDV